MNGYMKIAIAAAAVVVVAFVGINLLPRSGGIGPPAPTPSPTASPSPSKSPPPSPSPARIPDGPLAAGNYTTQPFTDNGLCFAPPQPGCTESAADDSIRITITLPDGWTGIEGWSVVPTLESYSPPGGAWLLFMRGGWLRSEICKTPEPDIPTGTTVDEFVTALVNHPELDLTSPVDVTLGGYPGKYLELQMPANVVTGGKFPPGPGEVCSPFVWEPGIYAQGPSDLWHIWVLDVGGVRVVIRSDTFPGTTPKVQAELQAIVDSIKIQP